MIYSESARAVIRDNARVHVTALELILTVTMMQWKSLGSPVLLLSWLEFGSSITCARRLSPDTRRMLMSLSQQKACKSVK